MNNSNTGTVYFLKKLLKFIFLKEVFDYPPGILWVSYEMKE